MSKAKELDKVEEAVRRMKEHAKKLKGPIGVEHVDRNVRRAGSSDKDTPKRSKRRNKKS